MNKYIKYLLNLAAIVTALSVILSPIVYVVAQSDLKPITVGELKKDGGVEKRLIALESRLTALEQAFNRHR